jgi:hypothetical protein
VFTLIFKVDADHLVMTGFGPSTPLTASSETAFSAADGTILKFQRNEAGAVNEVDIQTVEGNFKAPRK